MLVRFIVAVLTAIETTSNIGIAGAQVCVNEYPQLSCGLNYNSESDCIGANCCWNATTQECFVPSIAGYKYTSVSTSESILVGNLSLIEET